MRDVWLLFVVIFTGNSNFAIHTKNAQLVTNLQRWPAADLLQAWWTQQPRHKLFQQLVIGLQVNKLWVTNLVQLDKITALLQTCWQTCYKLVTSTTCWQVVRFCVCILNYPIVIIQRPEYYCILCLQSRDCFFKWFFPYKNGSSNDKLNYWMLFNS